MRNTALTLITLFTCISIVTSQPNFSGLTLAKPADFRGGDTVRFRPQNQATATVTAPPNPTCPGVAVTFICTVTNIDPSAGYQWRRNGLPLPNANASTFTSTSLANNDNIDCIVTGFSSGTPVVVTSNTIKVAIGPRLPPVVSATISPDTKCYELAATVTATSANLINPSFQWFSNGNPFLAPGPQMSGYFNFDDVVVCRVIGLNLCNVPDTVYSQPLPLKDRHDLLPMVTIEASDSVVCSGTLITFKATNVSRTANEVYTWLVNGAAAGSGNTFSSSTLTNNARVECIMTVPQCYGSGGSTKDYSNVIVITILPHVIPSVTITPAAVSICSDSLVTFKASAVHPGAAPLYQWQVNGQPAGTNQPVFAPANLQTGDVVSCMLHTGIASCSGIASATSNPVAVTVRPAFTPAISIAASHNPVCTGKPVTVAAATAVITGKQEYLWRVNGQTTGGAQAVLPLSNPENGQQIQCILLADTATCRSQAASNIVQLTVHTSPTITFTPPAVNIKPGQQALLHATVTGNPVSWGYTPASKTIHSTSASTLTIPLNESTTFTLRVTDANGCVAQRAIEVNVLWELMMPNSFTPNGDGINDVFKIPRGMQVQLKAFNIYDRWGNLVFTTNNVQRGWDGRLKGTPLASGTFAYTIEGTLHQKPVFQKGMVLLLR